METITTQAWVLYPGPEGRSGSKPQPAEIQNEPFSFSAPAYYEVLAEPLYGCWEANMTHALERYPIDICRDRKEEKVVIGNAGVVRILKPGLAVKSVKEGDLCVVFCNGVWDELGFPEKILAYDAPGTIGVLARRIKLHEKQVIRIPDGTRFSLQQWAAFSLRYITAWANWEAAYGCWSLRQAGEYSDEAPTIVWGWGGGVSLAELTLARHFGCEVAMLSSNDERLALIASHGIKPIDRRQFPNLYFDEQKYRSDPKSMTSYQESEESFLSVVREETRGAGVSIFVDYIGEPVVRATLKSLARQGVLTTAGWKGGMKLTTVRAIECMGWHTHVHTHYARYSQGVAATRFAEEKGWMPPVSRQAYAWDEIPSLARDYREGRTDTYFPIYQVNPV